MMQLKLKAPVYADGLGIPYYSSYSLIVTPLLKPVCLFYVGNIGLKATFFNPLSPTQTTKRL